MATTKVSSKFTKKASSSGSSSSSSGGGTYEKMVAFKNMLSLNQPLVVGKPVGLTEGQSSVLQAVKNGQTDVQSLSTYSGLSPSEVTRTLKELQSMGELPAYTGA